MKIAGIIAVVAVIIGVIILYSQNSRTAPGTEKDYAPVTSNDEQGTGSEVYVAPTNETGDAPQTGFAKLGENAIYVAEQQPGTKIVVNNVNIVPKGYVVIHESESSAPGKVIGYASLEKGSQVNNVTVTLDRPVTDGEELIAMLYADNGDNKFNTSSDTPVLDTLNNPLHMIFYVSAEASDPSSIEVLF